MASKYATTIWIAASVAALGAGYAASSRADTVVIDDQLAVRKSDTARPVRGTTMSAVAAKFGTPTAKHDAVGTPPITRWDYPQFAVFFEKDRVIDAVIPPPSAPLEPIPASVPEPPAAQQSAPSEDPVGVVPVSISPASHDASTAAPSSAASPAAAKPPASTVPPHP